MYRFKRIQLAKMKVHSHQKYVFEVENEFPATPIEVSRQ